MGWLMGWQMDWLNQRFHWARAHLSGKPLGLLNLWAQEQRLDPELEQVHLMEHLMGLELFPLWEQVIPLQMSVE